MSLRHALLGLLHERPASGYDLLQTFKVSLYNTWPATQSQVYTELGKLAAAGLLSVTPEGPRGRKEYALTDAGLAELRRWLLETEPDRYPRSEALLRIFLLGALTRDQARDYLLWLGRRADEDVAALTAFEASVEWNEDEDLHLYGRLVVEFGRRLWVMSSEWADWAAEQVKPRPAADQATVDQPDPDQPDPEAD